MNKNNKKYEGVMLSSTFRDLEQQRQIVFDAMLRADLHPIGMEYGSALPSTDALDASIKMVDEAQAYVGLIGKRYGHIPEDPDRNPQGLSLTELEYRRAIERKLPVCMFLMAKNYLVTEDDIELDPDKRDKLRALKEEVQNGVVYAEFSSPEDLKAKALQTLNLVKEKLNVSPRPTPEPSTAATTRPPAPTDDHPQAPDLWAMPPYTPGHAFVGRRHELQILDDWAQDPENPVLLFEAIGGMGKSMLTWQWVNHQARRAMPDLAGIFW